jgi:Kef-type K+ transport system membrane component KefB
MEHIQQYTLLFVSLAVLILPGLSRLLRIPAVVAEMVFGVILGKSLLQFEVSGDWLPFLADLGFLMLMFQAGMEIDFGMLRKQSRGNIAFQFVLFAATFGLSLGFAFLMGRGMFIALVLSTTSLGLVMPILKESGYTRTELGQSILLAATLADFLTLFGITFFLLYLQHGLSWRFALPVPLFIGFGVLLHVGRLWAWWNPSQAETILGIKSDSQEIGVRLSMALLFLFVGLAELVHLEPVLGAFMGGAVLSFVFREKFALEEKLSAIGFGFLIPFFFIHVGMQFDLTNVANKAQLIFTAKLLGLALAVKLLPAALLILRGRSVKEAFQVGILLSSRLSLIIAAAAIGLQNNLITQAMKDAIVLLALITCFVGPTLFKLTLRGEKRG